LFEPGILCFFDHVRQRLHDLFFGVIDIAQLMHEEVVESFDVFTEQAHWCPRCDDSWGHNPHLKYQFILKAMVPGTPRVSRDPPRRVAARRQGR
ncbi:MAG: hypothetical protein WB019_22475, partial [Pseudolabrys sp.]